MADSIRQRIVSAIITRLQDISIANGYKTDIGTNVEDWRVDWQQDELPAISVCDMVAENNFEHSATQQTIRQLPIQIRIFTASSTPAADLRKMIADVEQAIRVDDRWKVSGVGLVQHTRPLRDGFLIPEGQFEIIGGVVEIEVQYLTSKFNSEG